jgi:hypothetical protein
MRPLRTGWVVIMVALPSVAMRGQDPVQREQEKASLLRFCQQTDLGAPATVQGAKDRTDCWKRMQLEGMGDAVVDAKYQAAVADYDRAVAADSARKSSDSSTTAVNQKMLAVQRAIQTRNLDDAESSVNDVLAVQPQNQRALAFRDRILALKRARQLKITLVAVGVAVLVLVAGLGVLAKKLGGRHKSKVQEQKIVAAQRKGILKIVDGIGRGKQYTIETDVFRIGAASSDKPEERNELILSDSAAAISRYHCSIIRRDGAFYLIDSSLNGTRLDGELLSRGEHERLADGAEFILADVARFKFLLI